MSLCRVQWICKISAPDVITADCVIPENIHTSPTEGIFSKTLPPLWISQLSFIQFFGLTESSTPPPTPKKFQSLLQGEYGYFLEQHIIQLSCQGHSRSQAIMSSSSAMCCFPSVKKQKHDFHFFVQCIMKQLSPVDLVFVISRVIKVLVRVISLSL